MGASTAAVAAEPKESPSQGGPWQAMARSDIQFIVEWAKKQHILAVYPDPARFDALLKTAQARAASDIPRIQSYSGYRHALNHFVSTFEDEHVYLSLNLVQKNLQWPGFLSIYVGGQYRTVAGNGTVADGLVISACDGKPLNAWVDELAPYEASLPKLESTRWNLASSIFRDVQSPFFKRPSSCTIDGKDVKLQWTPIDGTVFAQKRAALMGDAELIDRIEPFGKDGAWIMLQNIMPHTPAEVDALRSVIAQLPSLRSKKIIVVDERNNHGGPYEWFMAFLRGLYGAPYTDYYARARLRISAVYRATPEILEAFGGPPETFKPEPITMPPDGTTFDPDNRLLAGAVARHESVLRSSANKENIAKPASAPPSLVHAKVVVLTGYACGSACIGLVDEMKLIPGVTQAGVETFIDSRTGTPLGADLPSGNGKVSVPVMTRDGRQRGDNEPNVPDVVYHGNIEDTEAVKAWVRKTFEEAR
ncbi:hypothetical protein [Luteibacter yeojuensis]|nr:hypothetical protein [Luteibacter yeojuensis]